MSNNKNVGSCSPADDEEEERGGVGSGSAPGGGAAKEEDCPAPAVKEEDPAGPGDVEEEETPELACPALGLPVTTAPVVNGPLLLLHRFVHGSEEEESEAPKSKTASITDRPHAQRELQCA